MTAHQDVARLVAELRQQARNRTEQSGKGAEKVTVEWQAADCLESLSQALREAEAKKTNGYEFLASVLGQRDLEIEHLKSRLAEAMKLARYVSQESSQSLLRDAARAFIAGNGGKDE